MSAMMEATTGIGAARRRRERRKRADGRHLAWALSRLQAVASHHSVRGLDRRADTKPFVPMAVEQQVVKLLLAPYTDVAQTTPEMHVEPAKHSVPREEVPKVPNVDDEEKPNATHQERQNRAQDFVETTAGSAPMIVEKTPEVDLPSHYADLALGEEGIIGSGKHILVICTMKLKTGFDYLATAASFAAEASTGSNVILRTIDDSPKSLAALVYYIDPNNENMKNAYPNLLFGSNIFDWRALMNSVHTLTSGNKQSLDHMEYGKIYDVYFPPTFLRLFDGLENSILDMWCNLGCSMTNSSHVFGPIINPKLSWQSKSLEDACYAFCQGGGLVVYDEPQENQVSLQVNVGTPVVLKAMRTCSKATSSDCLPEVTKAMHACIKESASKLILSTFRLEVQSIREFFKYGDFRLVSAPV